MEEVFERRTAQRRLSMLLLGLFGVLGLVISAVGIYGVLAYTVAQRTREIGVRMAIGATRADVVRMVLTHAAMLVALGLLIGGVAATYLKAAAKCVPVRDRRGRQPRVRGCPGRPRAGRGRGERRAGAPRGDRRPGRGLAR